ncbi:MFS transporter [Marinomonas sp. 2405UD68-3]|uniref:MFS transporter n=1 Tax=Marinomonas sp. 2405UD68-3 TaxID=3391835 RepID=UPI0039C93993
MLGITVWGLAVGQALLITGNILLVSVTALIGHKLAPDLSLATLPIATQFLGLMGITLPAAFMMKAVGRKAGFFIGNMIGIVGATLAFYALQNAHFTLFCIATLLLGMSIGVGQQYRFAAIENAPSDKTPQAISLVMGAGIIAAVLGPNMAIWAEFTFPDTQYLGAFAALLVLYVLTTLLILALPLKQPTVEEQSGIPRSYSTLLKQPELIAAITSGVIGYGVMTLVMTATPLAMHGHGFRFDSTATVIQWHVLGMFAPSFFTGKLIQKFGTTSIIQSGCLLLILCVVLTQLGRSYWHFWIALLFLGIGWNFTFIGATTLLTKTYQPADKAKVQGLNDFMVFTGATIGSVLAGYWQNIYGWEILNLLMIPFIVVAMISVWMSTRKPLSIKSD